MIKRIIIILLLASIFVILYIGSRKPFTPAYHLYFHIYNAKGLEPGDNIFIRGVRAGHVDGLEIERDEEGRPRVVVDCWIEKSFKVEKDAEAVVTPYGFMGGKYLAILPGSKDAGIAPDGYHLYGRPGLTIEDIFRVDKNTSLPDFSKSKFSDTEFVERLRGKIFKWEETAHKLDKNLTGKNAVIKRKFQSIYKSTNDVIAKIKTTLPKMEAFAKKLNDTLDDTGMRLSKRITSFAEKADSISINWNKTIEKLAKTVNEKKDNIISVSADIDTKIKNLHQTTEYWQRTLSSLDNIISKALHSKGLLRLLLNDRKTAEKLNNILNDGEVLLRKTAEVLKEMREDPDKYFLIYFLEREKEKK